MLPEGQVYDAAPIHRLPAEILSEILHLCVRVASARMQIAVFSLVCHHWNDIIQATPSIWSKLSTFDPQSFTYASLLRSKDSHLTIIYLDDERVYYGDFLRLLLPSFKRCRALYLSTTRREPLIQLEDTDLSRVEEAFLFSSTFVGQLRFLKGDKPQLRRLNLYDVGLQWDSLCLPNLQELTINYTTRSSGLAAKDLLGILSGCPVLQALDVSHVCIDANLQSYTIRLPFLQRLCLSVPTRLMHALLQSLEAPNINALRLKYRAAGADDRTEPLGTHEKHLDFLNEHISSLLRTSAIFLDVKLGRGTIYIRALPGNVPNVQGPCVTLFIFTDRSEALLKWLADTLAVSSVRSTRLGLFHTSASIGTLLEMQRLPFVKEIKIGLFQALDTIIELMRRPQLAFPNLEALSALVAVLNPQSALIPMICDRYSRALNDQVVPLKTLDLYRTRLSSQDIRQLEAVLGPWVLKCRQHLPDLQPEHWQDESDDYRSRPVHLDA